jgi:hydrogenase-4 component B
MSVVVLLLTTAALFITALGGTVATRTRAGGPIYALTGAMCALAAAVALIHLLTPHATPATLVLPLGLPWIGAHFNLDPLAAVFIVIIDLGGALASLYALGYGAHEDQPQRVVPFFPAFIAAMNIVVLAADAFTFLMSWEVMSLVSWALVVSHHRDAQNLRAGMVYLVMAGLGTMALLLAFGLLAGTEGNYAFDAIRSAPHAGLITNLVVVLALFGAGSKAGLVPLHVWLPLAHPAAPSHVSALMSGVMTKVAIYAFVRIIFDLTGVLPWWSGLLVLVIGGVSAAWGVLNALMQSDLKRLLAYSTIENVGIIFLGLGLAMAFQTDGMKTAAALALTAALLHAFNHSLFKPLLFFGAGAVLTATGERDMDRLGGLIHVMPVTAALFLTGSVAIAALPPLNGFASEWLTFQAILLSPDLPQWGLKVLVPAVGGLLALSAALAAAAFVKAYGITFLGRPRTSEASGAKEVDRYSLTAMGILAALCVAAGVLPGLLIDALSPVVALLTGERMPAMSGRAWLTVAPVPVSATSYDGLLVFVFIALSTAVAVLAIHRLASRAVRRAPAWDCGFPEPSPMTQYGGSSFVQPIRRVFGERLLRVRERVDMPLPGETRPARIDLDISDSAWDLLYAPVVRLVAVLGERLNALQFLTIRRYLTLVFLALVALLLVLAPWA